MPSLNIVATRPVAPGRQADRPDPPPPAARRPPPRALALAALAIFLLALGARLAGLEQHLTADDQDWVRRAVRFSQSLQRGDLRGTYQSGHPGVPVLWLAHLAIGPERVAALASAGGLDELVKSPAYLPAVFETRRALAVASAALTAVLALLAGRLFGPSVGLPAGLLLAGEPFLAAHGRLFHTDPLLAQLMTISVLAALIFFRGRGGRAYLLGSGLAAGLALLTKAPAIFLFGFVPLLALTGAWRGGGRPAAAALRRLAPALLPWALAAGAAYLLLWPALWVDPLGTLGRMAESVRGVGESPRRWGNFFLGQPVPGDVGPLFYPVVTLLRLSPVTLVGLALLALVGLRGRRAEGGGRKEIAGAPPALALLDYVVLFTAMMTLSDKKLDRYLLPVFPILVILAALGFSRGLSRLTHLSAPAPPLLLALAVAQFALLAGAHPYPLSFFNPLLGGLDTARRAVIVGWGEGTDQVAAYLDTLPNAEQVVVTTLYHDQVQPLARGRAVPLWEWRQADYFADYVNMEQRQIAADLRRALGEVGPPLFVVRINGLEYARIYPIPPELTARPDLSEGLRGAPVPKP